MYFSQVTLEANEVYKLLSAGSGDAALILLSLRSGCPEDQLSYTLKMSDSRFRCAVAVLRQLQLWPEAGPGTQLVGERPNYSEQDVTDALTRSPEFSILVGEVQRTLGRVLTTEELKTLLSLRDYLKMPPEVVSMALTHCLQKIEYYNKAHGAARTMSIRTLEKECYDWANKGILTLEQASRFISHDLDQLAPESQVKKLMGLDRPLADSEKEYIRAWLNMGFDTDTIKLAYDKTVLATGKLAWRYMNKVLLNWHEKNLHTVQQVNSENKKQPVQAETH
ncbi:MAG: DnaD domain protein, partial [Oscillibacter sp.]|nr:DnaD domain protein [Oscillibacter sp.]